MKGGRSLNSPGMKMANTPSSRAPAASGLSLINGAMNGGTLIGIRGVRVGLIGRKGLRGFGAVRRGRTGLGFGRVRGRGLGPKTAGVATLGRYGT
jgi:hypothetical protein